MNSLRGRIAVWYGALLIAVIVVLAVITTARFDAILHNQARERLVGTMADVERAAHPSPGTFQLQEPFGDPVLALENADALERWASDTRFLQIDDRRGHLLAKSLNMGRLQFPLLAPPAAGDTVTRTIALDGHRFMIAAALIGRGRNSAVAEIGEPLDELHQVIAQTQQSIAIVLAAAVVAVALLSFLLASEITNPIDELARAMREIGSDRLNQRLRWKGRPDEIGRLAASFDDLLGRLEEAFARERRFISDASHELKTPLTSIDANAQLLLRWADRDAAIRKESLETIVNESASLAGILSGMLALAKAESGDAVPKEPVSLRALAAQAVAAGAQGAAENGLTLQLESAQDTPIILGDASLLRRLIANLIENAVKFTDRGSVTVRVKTAGEEAVVEVEDTGRGIDSGDLPFIFDRFYRVDKSHSRAVPGTGLGLAIVRSIALMHDGRVEADRSPSGGTIVRAAFPRVTA